MLSIDLKTSTQLSEVAGNASLEELEADRAEVRRAMDKLRAHDDLLAVAIRLKKLHDKPRQPVWYPVASPELAQSLTRQSLRVAILSVLGDCETPLRGIEIFEELRRRDSLPKGKTPRTQLGARLSKMCGAGDVVALGTKGKLRYALNGSLAAAMWEDDGT